MAADIRKEPGTPGTDLLPYDSAGVSVIKIHWLTKTLSVQSMTKTVNERVHQRLPQ